MKVAIVLVVVLAVAGLAAVYMYTMVPGDQKEVHVIGISRWTSSQPYDENIQGFKDGLESLGLLEESVEFIIENPEGDPESLLQEADEIVGGSA